MIATSTTTLSEIFSSAPKSDIDLDLPGIRWIKPEAVHDLIKDNIADHLAKTSALDILVMAWTRYRDLRKHLGKDAQARSEPVLLSLVEHKISYTQHPSLQVIVNNAPAFPSIKIDVTVDFTLAGINLKIQRGRIIEVQAGKITCKGSVAYHGRSILKQELTSIELPGKIPISDKSKSADAVE